MKKVIEVLNYIMILLFATAAILQYNDPDSLVWIITYGMGSVVGVLWVQETAYYRYIAFTLAAVYLAWSFYIFPGSIDQQLFSSFSMQSIEIEEMRESLGLLVTGIWILVLGLLPRRKKDYSVKVIA